MTALMQDNKMDYKMVDLIAKKRDGGRLSAAELRFWLAGMLNGDIPDYQTAAMLMAIYFKGLDDEETCLLTEEIVRSGEVLDLSALPGCKADKHSTGGVGDKTTLVAIPLAAACGLTVVKMSGRSLGKTGGTADKLESVSGFRLALSPEDLQRQAEADRLVLISQSRNLTPADKRLYALRDLTATVDSLPLIAASVMSKKLAAGAEVIVLDVKFGSGAFMADAASARRLAELMVRIGTAAGRMVSAVISSMQAPLGRAVGNAVEVWEAAEVLRGRGAADVTELSLVLAAEMLYLGGVAASRKAGFAQAAAALDDGRGLDKLLNLLRSQGGDTTDLESGAILSAPVGRQVYAPQSGWLAALDAEAVATLVQNLGAGRLRVEDEIDHSVGVWLQKQVGDELTVGEPLAIIYANDEDKAEQAAAAFEACCQITAERPNLPPLIHGAVTAEGFIPWADLAPLYGLKA